MTLVEPVIKHSQTYDPTKPIRLNKQNNIEWELQLEASETKEILLKYSIDHPANETIETNNVAATADSSFA